MRAAYARTTATSNACVLSGAAGWVAFLYIYIGGSSKKRRGDGLAGGPGAGGVVKIGLQLYKVQQNIYLLDFQKLEGNGFSFMNICALIVTQLKTLSASSKAITVRVYGRACIVA